MFLYLSLTLAVSEVLGIDFKQYLRAWVKAQLPKPGPEGAAFPEPVSGSHPPGPFPGREARRSKCWGDGEEEVPAQ